MNSLSFSRNQCEFTIGFANRRRIHYEFTICFAISLWIRSIFSNSPWIHDPFQTTMILIWNHYEFTIFFTLSIRIHHLFRECIICFANFLWIHYFFPNSLWIHYLLRYFNMNTISFANSPWIHDLLRNHYDFAM